MADDQQPTSLDDATAAALEAEAAVADLEDERAGGGWARRYPPMLSMLAGLLIAIMVMPSSLNLPQNNPTQTLEFAPVPPEDSDDPPPPEGNFDQLGLGSSESLGGDAAGGDGPGTSLPPPVTQPGASENISEYRCVEGRQTEDPLSPPCVAFFDGDNFGATYQGVSEDEINVLIYVDGSVNYLGTSRGSEIAPSRTYVDLVNDPPQPDEHVVVRMLRGWQQYFNTRYQTYGRFVHFTVYFSGADRTPESRRADAADNFSRVEPFAAINKAAFDGGGDAYLDSMLKRGVLNFGSFLGQSAEFYSRFPSLLWGFLPSLEIQAQQFGDVLCKKYIGDPANPFAVDHSAQFAGQPRKFGLVYTTDPGYEGLREFKDTVVARFQECGGEIVETATFPQAGYTYSTEQGPSYAVDGMARMQAAGVTTIIWPGGLETKFSAAAANLNYRPELIIAGDGLLDAEYPNEPQEPTVWSNAVVMSNQTFEPDDITRKICFQAYRTIDPEANRGDVNAVACDYYNDLRQLFIGIQVAGPRLGPTSIDKGFHAIPAVASDNAQVPACYYLPNDYTCIKDIVLGRWNPAGREGSSSPACWQFAAGRRYLTSEIPDGNATAQMSPDDPCLGYDTSQQLSTAPPEPGNL